MFAVVYIANENKVYALNASGKAPSGATVARMKKLGYCGMPQLGAGFGHARRRHSHSHGARCGVGLGRSAASLRHADVQRDVATGDRLRGAGFPISERIAHDWELPKGLGPVPSDPRECCKQLDPDSIATWYIDGRQPVAGQIHRNPGLARTFRILQQQGRDGFYKGEIAQAIVDKSNRHGGTMTLEDLAAYSGEWTTRATNYHGYDVFTLPPPAQTWATDEILNILEACVPKWAPGQTLASLGPANPKYWHLFVEAKKLAFNDLYAYNARSEFLQGAAGAVAVQSTCRVVVRQGRSESSLCRRLAAMPTATATLSCCRLQTASATWSLGSTVSTMASALA